MKEEIVTNIDQILNLIAFGSNNRKQAKTGAHDHSSRSHSVFRMVVESRERSEKSSKPHNNRMSKDGVAVRVSVLNLVDLAGSERVSQTSMSLYSILCHLLTI